MVVKELGRSDCMFMFSFFFLLSDGVGMQERTGV